MEEIERGENSGEKREREREERKGGREEEEEAGWPYPGTCRPPGGRQAPIGHPEADRPPIGHPEADRVLELKILNLAIWFSNFVQNLSQF